MFTVTWFCSFIQTMCKIPNLGRSDCMTKGSTQQALAPFMWRGPRVAGAAEEYQGVLTCSDLCIRQITQQQDERRLEGGGTIEEEEITQTWTHDEETILKFPLQRWEGDLHCGETTGKGGEEGVKMIKM